MCSCELEKNINSYVCKNGHSFDISRRGYVNLLLSNTSSDKRHGDDSLMVNARRAFLEKGYYGVLSDAVNSLLACHAEKGGVLADAGCGEGWYTQRTADFLNAGQVYGIDISKHAAAAAAKRNKNGNFAVASIYGIPLGDSSVQVLLSIFAPHSYEEFARVLSPDGCLVRVIPLEDHLMGLKQAVYDTAYPNEPESPDISLFSVVESREVRSLMTLDNNADIVNLFMMTPYYYKTGESEQKKLAQLQYLTTQISFRVTLYRKNTAD